MVSLIGIGGSRGASIFSPLIDLILGICLCLNAERCVQCPRPLHLSVSGYGSSSGFECTA